MEAEWKEMTSKSTALMKTAVHKSCGNAKGLNVVRLSTFLRLACAVSIIQFTIVFGDLERIFLLPIFQTDSFSPHRQFITQSLLASLQNGTAGILSNPRIDRRPNHLIAEMIWHYHSFADGSLYACLVLAFLAVHQPPRSNRILVTQTKQADGTMTCWLHDKERCSR
jgi:hypothetical protein